MNKLCDTLVTNALFEGRYLHDFYTKKDVQSKHISLPLK